MTSIQPVVVWVPLWFNYRQMVDEREGLSRGEREPSPEAVVMNAVLGLVDKLAAEIVTDSENVMRRGLYYLPDFDGPFLAKILIVEVRCRTGDIARQSKYSTISFIDEVDASGQPLRGDALGITVATGEGLYVHSYGEGFGDAPGVSIIKKAEKAVEWLNRAWANSQLIPDDRTQAAIDAQE